MALCVFVAVWVDFFLWVKVFDFWLVAFDDLYICTPFHFHDLFFIDKTLLFSAGACDNP